MQYCALQYRNFLSPPVCFCFVLVLKSCPTLLWLHGGPGSSVQGIFQKWILEWVAISFYKGSSPPRNQTWVSCTAGRFFTTKPLGKPRHFDKWACFPLWPRCFILFGAVSNCPSFFPNNILDNFHPTWQAHFSVSCLFAFSYCPQGLHSKNIGVICHFLLQGITFCENSSLRPIRLVLGGPAWQGSEIHWVVHTFAMTSLWSRKVNLCQSDMGSLWGTSDYVFLFSIYFFYHCLWYCLNFILNLSLIAFLYLCLYIY